jgi:hypothetical protein
MKSTKDERKLHIKFLVARYDYLSIYGSTALVDLGRFFSFLIYTPSAWLLGRWISPSQGSYLHTEQHKHTINAHRHQCIEWDSNPRPQCSRGRRWLMPQTARPLWSVPSMVREIKSKRMVSPDMQNERGRYCAWKLTHFTNNFIDSSCKEF